jgi:hypothetical protein
MTRQGDKSFEMLKQRRPKGGELALQMTYLLVTTQSRVEERKGEATF